MGKIQTINEDMSRRVTQILVNELDSRARRFFKSMDGPRRDLNVECGYPEELTSKDYKEQYKRNGVAKRVVTLEAQESWKLTPLVYEDENPKVSTEFEKSFEKLVEDHNIWHYLKRADILSGIGHYGLLLMGVSDGQKLSKPAYKVDKLTGKPKMSERDRQREHRLLYLKPISQDQITDLSESDLETDEGNARFGKPNRYQANLGGKSVGLQYKNRVIHHTRVLHLADGRESSDVFGTPRMEDVFNNVFDVRKILGGSGEMFYKGGFPGISMELAPGAINAGEMVVEVDQKAVRDALERYMEGLQRYLISTGLSAKSLAPAIADPGPHLLVQLEAICIAKGVPIRIFMGSERGELASTQDKIQWNQRLRERQLNYLTPMVIVPFIEKMIAMNILPQPQNLIVEWPDLNAPSDKEKADIGKTRMEALGVYVDKKVNQVVGFREALTHIMGFKDREAEVLDESGAGIFDEEDQLEADIKKIEAAAKAKPQPSGGAGDGRALRPRRTGLRPPRSGFRPARNGVRAVQ